MRDFVRNVIVTGGVQNIAAAMIFTAENWDTLGATWDICVEHIGGLAGGSPDRRVELRSSEPNFIDFNVQQLNKAREWVCILNGGMVLHGTRILQRGDSVLFPQHLHIPRLEFDPKRGRAEWSLHS